MELLEIQDRPHMHPKIILILLMKQIEYKGRSPTPQNLK